MTSLRPLEIEILIYEQAAYNQGQLVERMKRDLQRLSDAIHEEQQTLNRMKHQLAKHRETYLGGIAHDHLSVSA